MYEYDSGSHVLYLPIGDVIPIPILNFVPQADSLSVVNPLKFGACFVQITIIMLNILIDFFTFNVLVSLLMLIITIYSLSKKL